MPSKEAEISEVVSTDFARAMLELGPSGEVKQSILKISPRPEARDRISTRWAGRKAHSDDRGFLIRSPCEHIRHAPPEYPTGNWIAAAKIPWQASKLSIGAAANGQTFFLR